MKCKKGVLAVTLQQKPLTYFTNEAKNDLIHLQCHLDYWIFLSRSACGKNLDWLASYSTCHIEMLKNVSNIRINLVSLGQKYKNT